jgi:hypothetical protein
MPITNATTTRRQATMMISFDLTLSTIPYPPSAVDLIVKVADQTSYFEEREAQRERAELAC